MRTDPVRHNLILTLLDERVAHPLPARYCWAVDGTEVVGFAFQSPLQFLASITPMPPAAVEVLVDYLSNVAPDLPGVMGEADTASRFAGRWGEVVNVGAVPEEGQRLYELGALQPPNPVPGRLRVATLSDGELVLEWLRGFEVDTGGTVPPPDAIRRRISSGLVWIWEDNEPTAMAGFTSPVAGVSRIGHVYTPPQHRRHGYAAACTAAVSEVALAHGADRCILFTQLENSQSNAIYRRLGYEAASEIIRYRFLTHGEN